MKTRQVRTEIEAERQIWNWARDGLGKDRERDSVLRVRKGTVDFPLWAPREEG